MYKQLLTISLLMLCFLEACFCQNKITGNWISEEPEMTATGSFGIRQFNIAKEAWEVQYTVYLDNSLTFPVFTFRATGKYSMGKQSTAVSNTKEVEFAFDKKYVTLKTNDTVLIRKFGLDKCNLIFLKEKDITEMGCAYLASKVICAQEFDLVSISGNMLYLGARPISGGMCEESKRPKTLGRPLKRIIIQKPAKKSKTLSLDNVHIVDLTHTLNAKFPFIPTPVTFAFELKPIATIDNFGVAANEWKIHEHIGTQLDAPNHFAKGGMSADQIDVHNLLVPAVVIDISEKTAKNRDAVLIIEDILNWEKQYGTIPQNAAVLMYSGWDKKIYSSEFIGMDSVHKKHFPGISKEAAEFLVNKRSIAGVGVDVVSFDPGIDDTYQTHRIILEKGKWALECLANLDKIPATGAYVFVGAPKVEGATGGLSRVIAIW